MEDKDFVYGFQAFTIAYYYDNYANSIYENSDDAGAPLFFSIPVTAVSSLYMMVDFYPLRMYPLNCRFGSSSGLMSVYHNNGSSVSMNNIIDDNSISNTVFLNNTAVDTYVAKVEVQSWDDNAVKDFTFRVYGPSNYTITLMNSMNIKTFLTTMQTNALQAGFSLMSNTQQSSFTYANANSGTYSDVGYFELAAIGSYSSTCKNLAYTIVLSGVDTSNSAI